MPLTTDDVREALKKVVDPEIHINVVDLGIVYGVDIKPDGKGKNAVALKVTLTTPACPYGPMLLSRMHAEVTALAEVSDVDIDLVWNPPWDPRTMASPDAKMMMGFLDFDDMEETEEEKKAVP